MLLLLLLACRVDVKEPAPRDSADTDTPCTPVTVWSDTDGDGFGAGEPLEACSGVTNGDDCDDGDPAIHPDATEICDGIDGDCDGVAEELTSRYADADGDGYGAGEPVEGCSGVTDGDDCDDADATVHPGAEELCNLRDDDCDGAADLGEEGTWYSDLDGDGYGSPLDRHVTCEPDAGWVTDGTDCVPGDAEAYPGAPERCNDIDDDCDRTIDEGYDTDGDGYRALACPDGDDCDDADGDVHPEATEACEDGIDDDCDGADMLCGLHGAYSLADATAKVYGVDPEGYGGLIVTVGDADGDGRDDVLANAPYGHGYAGGAFLVPGPIAGISAADAVGFDVAGEVPSGGAGRSIGMGDVNGDGYDDVQLGAPWANDDGTWIVYGPVTGDVALEDADVRLTGPAASYLGHGSDLADVNGDGIADAVVGGYGVTTSAGPTGAAWVAYGPLAGELDLRTDGYEFEGESAGDYVGRIVCGGGDVDGDGIGDMVIGTIDSAVAPMGGGAYLVHGGVTTDLSLADADARLLGESASDYTSIAIAMGDVSGDGLTDIVLGSYHSVTGTRAGTAYVVYGPVSGELDLGSADLLVQGDTSGQMAGQSVAAADIDGDGIAELLVGAYGDGTVGRDAGAAFLFYLPPSGTLSVADADATFYAEAAGDKAGGGVALGDLDGDGWGEIVVGAPGESTGGAGAGAVYVFEQGI